jgi:hypothetical protein
MRLAVLMIEQSQESHSKNRAARPNNDRDENKEKLLFSVER